MMTLHARQVRRFSVQAGFTLIELMVVVAIVAVLASVAIPSFMDSTRKSRRADAVFALQQIQMEQEKLRANCTTYAANLTGERGCGVLGYPATTPEGYYVLSIDESSVTRTSFTVIATAKQGTSQVNDTGCTTLTLQVSGLSLTKTPAACWRN